MSRYEGDGSPESVLDWLNEGGYSCVLGWAGSGQRAFTVDEDEDEGYGLARIPTATARALVMRGQVAVWRPAFWQNSVGKSIDTYRPTAWVAAWNRQYPTKEEQSA